MSIILLCSSAVADETLKGIACRSVHLGFSGKDTLAFYNEVTPHTSAPGTFFMACGWNTGYFGLQELADGKKLVIFSVWDNARGDDPNAVEEDVKVKLLHQDPAVRVGRFGGEGTGGQSFSTTTGSWMKPIACWSPRLPSNDAHNTPATFFIQKTTSGKN